MGALVGALLAAGGGFLGARGGLAGVGLRVGAVAGDLSRCRSFISGVDARAVVPAAGAAAGGILRFGLSRFGGSLDDRLAAGGGTCFCFRRVVTSGKGGGETAPFRFTLTRPSREKVKLTS